MADENAIQPNLTTRLAELTAAGLPLVPGLRAAAAETPRSKSARELAMLAQRLESGQSLEDALAETSKLPPYLRALVRGALLQGTLPHVLTKLVEQNRRQRRMWEEVRGALSYSGLLLLLAGGLFLLVLMFVVPQFAIIFDDFEVQLPALTRAILWLSRVGIWYDLYLLGGIVAVILLVRLMASRATWDRLTSYVPLVGPLSHTAAVAAWLRMTALLVELRVPLPEALEGAGAANSSGYVGELSARLARQVKQGRSLGQIVRRQRALPASLVPLLDWGQKVGRLDEVLRTTADLVDRRVEQRARLLRISVPPVTLLLLASGVMLTVTVLILPLIALIQNLGGA